MKKIYTSTLKPLILALILSAGINYVYAGWVAPNAAPPAGNINTPINTGSTAQSKTGPFTAGWNGSVYGLNVTSAGKVGIGTASPSATLEVADGPVRVDRSTAGNGSIVLNPGGSNYQGYIDWDKPDGTRVGYMGYKDAGINNLDLTLNSSLGSNFTVQGGPVKAAGGLIVQTCNGNPATLVNGQIWLDTGAGASCP